MILIRGNKPPNSQDCVGSNRKLTETKNPGKGIKSKPTEDRNPEEGNITKKGPRMYQDYGAITYLMVI